MPFANLPVSGFQAPQAPDWTRFAEQANEFIAHQPIPNTAAMVDKAVEQINGILKLASPEERLKRQLERTQLGALQGLYTDYKAHPENYQMTAHGPVLIDPTARLARIAQINHTTASTAYLNKKLNAGTDPFIASKMPKMQAAMNFEKQGGQLSPSKMVTSEPVATDQAQPDESSDNAADTAVNDTEGVTGGGSSYVPFDQSQ